MEINTLLEQFINTECSCGKSHKIKLPRIIVKSGAINELPSLMKHYGYKKAQIIADQNTYKVAGESITKILKDFNLISPVAHLFNILFQDEKKALGFCAGLIELTNGCILLSKSSDALSISLTAFLISFGGLSVIIQSISFLKQANVNIKTFIFSKLIQAITTFIICLIMCKVGL